MADSLIFHLTVSVDPEDHEAIDFLRGLADDELVTRIETDGDNLTEITVMHVTTSSFEDEHNARVLAEYMGIDDDREEG